MAKSRPNAANLEQQEAKTLSTPSQSSISRDLPTPEEIAAEAAAIYPPGGEGPTADQIAAEAYAIYMSRGAAHGMDMDDWLLAEQRLKELRERTTAKDE